MVELFDGHADLRDECSHSVSFCDGDIEGSDLNQLWSILQGRPGGGHPICDEVFRDVGEGHRKLGRVSADCLRALAGMSDDDIRAAAAAWQQTGSLVGAAVEYTGRRIRELQRLSQRAIEEGAVVLLEGWC
jgi:hypothetical protein